MIKRYKIEEEIRIKDFLKQINIYDNIQKEIKKLNGQYLVNDQIVDNWYLMSKGDTLEIVFPASIQGDNIKSIYGPLDILYEDSYLLILNKDNNIATIPTREHYDKSLANYVMSYYKRKGIVSNIHFIGRLDFATSGIVMLAKNPYVMALMKETSIIKKYYLEVDGHLVEKVGLIELGIEKDPTSIIKRRITNDFINSKTTYKVIEEKENASIVEAILHTGKTHQLRLHFSYLGNPIIGDELYGVATNDGILRLHSHSVEFIHPVTGEKIYIDTNPSWYNKKQEN